MKRFWRGISTFILFFMLAQVSWVLAQGEDEILAKVGNEVITRMDYETRIKTLPPAARTELNNDEKRKQLLDSMVKSRLITMEGEKRGLTEKPDVKAKLRIIREDLITQEYVRAYLAKDVKISEEEIQNDYNTNPEYNERDLLKVSQIVVEKEDEAKEILEKLKKGEPFKKLAMERSVDVPTKLVRGELEWFVKGEREKEVEEALAKLEKGGISEIVTLKGKYYIFKLDDKRNVPKPPLLKVKDDIVKRLMYKKVTEIVDKEIEDLKKKTTIETFYNKLYPEGK